MTEAQAKRMGFKPDNQMLFRGPQYIGYWGRKLKRPACLEFWHPDKPNEIRRERWSGGAAYSLHVRQA